MTALHRRTHPVDVYDEHGNMCFGCKAVGFGFTYPWGQDVFHDTTIKETLDDMHKRAAENGITVEKVS
jgi:hypothetical protein